jgi:thiol-disulfide isomerase/thioredoxin
MKKILIILLFIIFSSFSAGLALAAEPTGPQTLEFSRTLKTLRAADAVSLVHSHKGKPVALFIYATWCPYCRGTMDSIKQVMEEGGFAGVEPVFLSLDTDFVKLSAYLLENDYPKLFAPYVLKSTGVNTIPDTLRAAFGTGFTGGIPYFALLDANGDLASELFGYAKPETLKKNLQQLSSN